MAYPFVAAPDHWPRGGVLVHAIAIHHAEGGGTVSWLTRDDGNSSHYVVERTGRVVQMVREDRAAGSINPKMVRLTDDAPFTFMGETVRYGVSANKAALGEHWRNPNAAVVAIEVEGFAADGPNAAQRVGLKELVADIRVRHAGVPALGHRDWQSYKACPGKRIPWVDYGGHGKAGIAAEDPDVPLIDFTLAKDEQGGTITVKPGGATVITIDGGERPSLAAGMVRPSMGPVFLAIRPNLPHYLVFIGTTEIGFVSETEVEFAASGGTAPAQVYPVTVAGKLVGEVSLP